MRLNSGNFASRHQHNHLSASAGMVWLQAPSLVQRPMRRPPEKHPAGPTLMSKAQERSILLVRLEAVIDSLPEACRTSGRCIKATLMSESGQEMLQRENLRVFKIRVFSGELSMDGCLLEDRSGYLAERPKFTVRIATGAVLC